MKYYNCSKCKKTYVLPGDHKDLLCSCGLMLDEILLDCDVAPGGIFFKHAEIMCQNPGVHMWMNIGLAKLDSRKAIFGKLGT